jgi:flagellar biosynthetic protein FliO
MLSALVLGALPRITFGQESAEGVSGGAVASSESVQQQVSEDTLAAAVATETAKPSSELQSSKFQFSPKENAEKLSVSDTSNWGMVLLTLLGIIASILLVAWIAKRFTGMSALDGKDMRVVGAIALGARERVAVIDVKGEQFLLGVTPHNISFLHRFDEAPISTARRNSGEFAQKLQAILNSSIKGQPLEESMGKREPISKSRDSRDTIHDRNTRKEAGDE